MQSEPTAMYKCSFCSSAIVAQDRTGSKIICLNCDNWQKPSGHRHFSIAGTRTNDIDGNYVEAAEFLPKLNNHLKKLDELETKFQVQNESEKIYLIKLQKTAVVAAIDLCKTLADRAKKNPDNNTTKICPKCFAKFDDMKFCLKCGNVLENQKVFAAPKNEKIINCEFELKCPLNWNSLQKQENSDIRFCTGCQKNVHFAHSQNDLDELIKAGKCVAFAQKSDGDFFKKNPPPECMITMGVPRMLPDMPVMLPEKKYWWEFWK